MLAFHASSGVMFGVTATWRATVLYACVSLHVRHSTRVGLTPIFATTRCGVRALHLPQIACNSPPTTRPGVAATFGAGARFRLIWENMGASLHWVERANETGSRRDPPGPRA